MCKIADGLITANVFAFIIRINNYPEFLLILSAADQHFKYNHQSGKILSFLKTQ